MGKRKVIQKKKILLIIIALMAFFLICLVGTKIGIQYYRDQHVRLLNLKGEEEKTIGETFKQSIPLDYFQDLSANEIFGFCCVKIFGDWATGEYTWIDKNTSNSTVGESAIAIFRKIDEKWESSLKSTQTYKKWLDEVPKELVPEDLKIFLR